MQWQVRFHPDAREEERKLPAREKLAMANAIDKLGALGPALPYPHSSDVRGADRLRELRPARAEADSGRCTGVSAMSC